MAKLGPPLKLTNSQLDKLAEITDEDIDRVNEKWQAIVPSIIKNLLLATPE